MCDFTEAEHMQKNLESSSILKAADETKAELKEQTIPREAKDENSARQAITISFVKVEDKCMKDDGSVLAAAISSNKRTDITNENENSNSIVGTPKPLMNYSKQGDLLCDSKNHQTAKKISSMMKPKLTLTRPKEPEFETSQHVSSVRVKSTAKLKEEMMAKIQKFKACLVNKKILEAPSLHAMSRSTPHHLHFRLLGVLQVSISFRGLRDEYNLGAWGALAIWKRGREVEGLPWEKVFEEKGGASGFFIGEAGEVRVRSSAVILHFGIVHYIAFLFSCIIGKVANSGNIGLLDTTSFPGKERRKVREMVILEKDLETLKE
ncbi:hypothetical protein ACLB2K_016610 [Fragaria x ananassa]